MFYPALCFIAAGALLLTFQQTRRMAAGGAALMGLYVAAIGLVLTGFAPAQATTRGAQLLCFAMLLPLFFWNVKQFTNLSLPQWRAVRAFTLGVPLLLGINGAVSQLDSAGPALSNLNSAVWVSYCFGLFSMAICLWRFISTPRQRGIMVVLMAVPATLIGVDLAARLQALTLWDADPTACITLAWLCLLSLFARHLRIFSIRPVPRSALVDQVQDGLLVLSDEQRIIDYNHAAAVLLGTSSSALIGRSAIRCLPTSLSEALNSDGAQALVLPWQLGADEHWFEVQIKPLLVDGQVSGRLVTLRDVSERRQAELALRDSRRKLEQANAKLESLANTDPLTSLHNRRALLERLDAEMDRHSRSGMTLGVLMVDLDHFKRINDDFGHAMGDEVLVATAGCMTRSVRDSDCVGRIGGEEFAILVVDATAQGPETLAERLCENLRKLTIHNADGQPIAVTASIGCVHFSGGMVDGATLLDLADQALYRAKRSGRDRVCIAQYQPLPRPSYGKPTQQRRQ